jgi:cytochrome c5
MLGGACATSRVKVLQPLAEPVRRVALTLDPVEGATSQRPFLIDTARRDCADYRATEERMPAAEAFLKTIRPMPLREAPDGDQYLTKDLDVLTRGKIVYADTCARCHSSKRPPSGIPSGSPAEADWFRQSVQAADFLDHNFLSDDERHPVTRSARTSRGLPRRATAGHIWTISVRHHDT